MYITLRIITDIFGKFFRSENKDQFSHMAILCPKNSDVHTINDVVLARLSKAILVSYFSVDSIDDENSEDRQNYPIEFLNALTPFQMPNHKLNLKIGSIIILLQNLNVKRGLCNGTLLVVNLKSNLIIAEVLTGSAEGQTVFIPRIDLALVVRKH